VVRRPNSCARNLDLYVWLFVSNRPNVFLNIKYLKTVPGWHIDDAAWKAKDVLRMLERNRTSPRRMGEVGYGTSEGLRQLQLKMAPACVFRGFNSAPQAIELSRNRR
jgi:hypothetical protein